MILKKIFVEKIIKIELTYIITASQKLKVCATLSFFVKRGDVKLICFI